MIDIKAVLGKEQGICLVVFSPLDALGKGGQFGWWKQLEHFTYPKVFVKDTENTWFLTQDGNTISIDSIAIKIETAIKSVCDISTSQLIFIGPSMGGFGAFLYGSLLQADHCWGTSVTNTLMHPRSISSRFLKDEKFRLSLNSFINNKTRYQLMVGDKNIFDLYSASLFPKCVEVSLLSNSGHVVPEELKKRGVSIGDVIQQMLKGFRIEDNNLGFSFDDIRKDIFYYFMLNQGDSLAMDRLKYSSQSEECNIWIFNLIKVRAFRSLGENERAMEIVNKSILMNKMYLDWDIYHLIGLLFRDMRFYEESLFYFEKSLALKPDSKGNIDQIKRVKSVLNMGTST